MRSIRKSNFGEDLDEQEPLISLLGVSERIKVVPYYYQQRLPGSVNQCYLRDGVIKKLLSVVNQLPSDCYLVIWDGWRSYETQSFLYEITKGYFEKRYSTPEKVLEELGRFVSVPSKDPINPSPHYTGGAVDLTIANKEGLLNMGTEFDEFIEEAYSDYYEKKEKLSEEEVLIRNNRRMLRNAMEQAGFQYNPDEWWHYDYGNLRWAEGKKKDPLYMGTQLKI